MTTKLYFRNLFSLRTVFGIAVTPLVLLLGLTMFGIPMEAIAWLYFPLMIVLLWVFLTHQMVCNACGRALSTTRLSGEQLLCRHCQTPTDKAVALAAKK